MLCPRKTGSLLLVLALARASAAPGADRTLAAAGTIVKVDARSRTLVVAVADGPETIFVWTADTKIAGTLAPGARVTVRYTPGEDGKNLALQITVSSRS
jgi:hypothetical protein